MLLNRNYLFLTLAVLFLFSRLLRLDADIPIGWDVAQYSQLDELLYSAPGINLFHYGSWDIRPQGLSLPQGDIFFSIWNFIQFFLLTQISNPLFALRLAAVIAGLTVYLLYLFCLERLKERLKRAGYFDTSIYALFAILPLFDLTFFLSNVINEPTIYRLMSASLIFFLLLNNNNVSVRKSFFLGIIAASSVVFIYIYNAFLILFVALVLLVKKRHSFKLLISFAMGLLLAFTTWLLLHYFFFGTTPLELIEHFVSLTAMRPVNIRIQFYDYVIRLASVFATNFLIFSPILFILVLTSPYILLSFHMSKKLRVLTRNIAILFFLYLVSYAIQLMLVPDFPQRKGLILYTPILIMSYLIAMVLTCGQLAKKKNYMLAAVLIIIINLFILIYSIKLAKFINHRDYFSLFKEWNIGSITYVTIYLIAMFGIAYIIYFRKNTVKKSIVAAFVSSTIFCNGYLVVKYCLINADYTFSDLIADVRKLPPGNFIGNWSYGLSFANRDNKPLITYYLPRRLQDPIWWQSDNELNMKAFNLLLNNDLEPTYTAVQGRDHLKLILEKFPAAKIRYANAGFRDQTSYISYNLIKRSVLIGDKVEDESLNEMYIIQLNP